MINNSPSDSQVNPLAENRATGPDLSEFDGQRMAVILDLETGRVVLRGCARFVRDDVVGNTLHIQLDDQEPGRPVIVISEREWTGRIIPDFHYGCQFSLIVN